MKKIVLIRLLFILGLIQSGNLDAQNLTDTWRVLKKTVIHQNGQRSVYEYLYSYDNRIKSVKYLSANGALFLTINNFNFNRNNKPESYTVQYNDGSKINVRVKYDNQGRVTELEKIFGREITIFNYRYSGNSIVVTQKITNTANPIEKGNRVTFYTEQGDHNETTSDPATKTITSVITLKKNRDSEIFPHPDDFMGGFEPPRFLGVLAFGSEPEITATKDENGLVTSLSYVARGSNRTFEYTYLKVKGSEPATTNPVENIPETIITTNINCEAGKEMVERILKSQDGVQSVKVDTRTGKLSLAYSSDGTPYTEIINLINEAGFNADRIKSNSPDKNPCKQPEPEEQVAIISFQTNINCPDGKEKIETLLKEQTGVLNATVDFRTGKLEMEYNKSDITIEAIIRIINKAGFDADRKKSSHPQENICIKKNTPAEVITKQSGPNIFDARKGFAKAPIKFVPFVVTPDAAQKGFKMDSVYTWVAPDGKTKQATGEEILAQVNAMEKELSLRGHTLRKRNAFSGLNYKLVNPGALLRVPKPVSKISNNVDFGSGISKNFNSVPVIKPKRNTLPKLSGTIANTIAGDVGIYFGSITSAKGEFQGMISTAGTIDNSKCKTQCPLDITLSLDATKIQSLNISKCILEISANPNRLPNDDEDALAIANFNFKSPAKTKYGIQNVTVNGEVPPSSHTLYYFPVKLNDLSKLGNATIQPAVYYAYVKFYNDKGQLLYYSSYNTAILENKIAVPIFISADKNVNVKLEDAFTDPTGLFGMYYKANNLNAAYSIKRDDATLLITENTKLSGDIEIGAQYYNFWYLLDDDQPKFERKPVVSANFSSDYTNQYKAGVPDIRIPGNKKGNDMNGYGGYQVNYSLYDFEKDWDFDKRSSNTEAKGIGYTIFDERFFIGPVPCKLTVSVSGNASFTRQAVMDTLTNGNVSIATEVKPHLELKVSGSGAVDAGVAYAKVVCDVKVIEVDLPISVKANVKADIDAALVITALSGRVYFEAGLCIPIPYFDDICTSFKIDIFDWTGPGKTYPLVK